jgi:hypothetical protein
VYAAKKKFGVSWKFMFVLRDQFKDKIQEKQFSFRGNFLEKNEENQKFPFSQKEISWNFAKMAIFPFFGLSREYSDENFLGVSGKFMIVMTGSVFKTKLMKNKNKDIFTFAEISKRTVNICDKIRKNQYFPFSRKKIWWNFTEICRFPFLFLFLLPQSWFPTLLGLGIGQAGFKPGLFG